MGKSEKTKKSRLDDEIDEYMKQGSASTQQETAPATAAAAPAEKTETNGKKAEGKEL